MTSTGGSTTPAGWYTDPGGSGQLRWWDGTVWSAHLAPKPTPEPTPTFEPAPTFEPEPTPILAPTLAPALPQSLAGFGYGGASAVEFAVPTRWNTAWAWLLALSNIISLVVVAGYIAVEYSTLTLATEQLRQSTIVSASTWIQVALWVLLVIFALMDRKKLVSFGYARPARAWWILLFPPLAYLIMRGIAISREVRHGFGPLIAYLVSVGVVVILGIGSAIAIPLFLASRAGVVGSEPGAAFASSLQTGLDQNGGHFTVTCPVLIPNKIGTTFRCRAVDSTGIAHTLSIQVIEGTNGKPGVKLLSVAPPISG